MAGETASTNEDQHLPQTDSGQRHFISMSQQVANRIAVHLHLTQQQIQPTTGHRKSRRQQVRQVSTIKQARRVIAGHKNKARPRTVET